MTEDTTPKAGDLIAGKYRIEHVLGHGGMGTVFAARRTVTERELAVKWLRPELAANPEWMRRFVREARAAGRVHHDNVVDIYDVDEHGGAVFLVMERLHGRPFSALCAGGPLPVCVALGVLLPAMRGMRALHQQGVIHRDLKPANIFVCEDEAGATVGVKVLDFGISKIVDPVHDDPTLTDPGALLGTPSYMAPEQLRGTPAADCRVDVFAFAVILYRALAGRTPFQGESDSGLVLRIATEDPALLHHVAPQVPEGLSLVVARSMARDRDQRYPDLTTLIAALQPFADGAGTTVSGVTLDGARPETPSASTRPAPTGPKPVARWHWLSLPVVALSAMAALAATRDHRAPPESRSASATPILAATASATATAKPWAALTPTPSIDPAPSAPHSRATPPPAPYRPPRASAAPRSPQLRPEDF
jgi:serine/threonine protein kinase